MPRLIDEFAHEEDDATTLIVKAVGRVYKQTHEFAHLRKNVTLNPDLSIGVYSQHLVQLPEGWSSATLELELRMLNAEVLEP